MYSNLVYVISGLFPPGIDEIVKAVFLCFAVFTIAGVIYCVIRIVNHLKGLIHFG